MQLELFSDANLAYSSRVVKTVSTDLGPFGNRTDEIVVEGDTVRGVSHLVCDNPDVLYFNHRSPSPSDEGHLEGVDDMTSDLRTGTVKIPDAPIPPKS